MLTEDSIKVSGYLIPDKPQTEQLLCPSDYLHCGSAVHRNSIFIRLPEPGLCGIILGFSVLPSASRSTMTLMSIDHESAFHITQGKPGGFFVGYVSPGRPYLSCTALSLRFDVCLVAVLVSGSGRQCCQPTFSGHRPRPMTPG